MGAVGVLPQCELTDRIHFSVEAVPADVRGDGDLDRQRAAKEVAAMGAVDGEAVQEAVSGEANAGVAASGVGIDV